MTINYRTYYQGIEEAPAGEAPGYPLLGPQSSTADGVAGDAFFASVCKWDKLANQPFNYIVVGTGPTGAAFVDQIYKHNPKAKMLMLERGGFWQAVHYQMLPAAFDRTTGSPPTTYPWSRRRKMRNEALGFFQAGYIPFHGGRSTCWSAWSPSPAPDLLRNRPQEHVPASLFAEKKSHPRSSDCGQRKSGRSGGTEPSTTGWF